MHDGRASAAPIATKLNWKDAPSRMKPIESWYASCQSFRLHRSQFSHQSMPSQRWLCSVKPLSAPAHTAGEHARKLRSCGVLSCPEMKLAFVENETLQVTFVGENNSFHVLLEEFFNSARRTLLSRMTRSLLSLSAMKIKVVAPPGSCTRNVSLT